MSGLLARATAALALLAALVLPAAATTIERVVSPGGIEAWLVSEDTVPIISVNFAFRGGANQDPAGKPGVANLVSGLLDEGAGDLDSQAFQRRIEELAVRLQFDAGRDAFFGEMKTLVDNRDAAFALLAQALAAPRFDQDAIERVRAQVIAGLRRDQQDPDGIAGKAFASRVFGDHPYGRPVEGTLDSVAAITREDLAGFAARALARDNLVVAVVGAIDAKTLAPLLDQVFGGLPETARLVAVPPAAPPAEGFVEAIALDVPQTAIRFGRPGLKRDDPDFIPAFVVNHILGGGAFSSRLYAEVREARGLAYSVFSFLWPMDHAALFMGGVGTRGERADESLAVIRAEVERMAAEGPTADELAAAKSFLKGSYPLRFDTSDKIAGQLVQIQLEDLGIDYIERRNDLIEAVTIDDVRRAAARLLGDGSLYVTVVGRTGPGGTGG